MAASTNPVQINGALTYPPDEGATPVPVSYGISATYKSVADQRLVMTGSGTQVVPFGTVATPGAKAMLVEYEADAAGAAIQLRFNGGTDNIELSPGGFWAYGNPVPSAGVTSLSIVHTSDCVVRVRVFG